MRQEFPIKVEYEAYIIPTVGIFFCASAVIAIPLALFLCLGGHGAVSASLAMGISIASGVIAVSVWIIHLRRVHTGRKIILDDDGITYFHFANDKRTVAWDDIDQFKIFEGTGSESPSYCEIYAGGKQKLKFESDFADYFGLQKAIQKQIPKKTKIEQVD